MHIKNSKNPKRMYKHHSPKHGAERKSKKREGRIYFPNPPKGYQSSNVQIRHVPNNIKESKFEEGYAHNTTDKFKSEVVSDVLKVLYSSMEKAIEGPPSIKIGIKPGDFSTENVGDKSRAEYSTVEGPKNKQKPCVCPLIARPRCVHFGHFHRCLPMCGRPCAPKPCAESHKQEKKEDECEAKSFKISAPADLCKCLKELLAKPLASEKGQSSSRARPKSAERERSGPEKPKGHGGRMGMPNFCCMCRPKAPCHAHPCLPLPCCSARKETKPQSEPKDDKNPPDNGIVLTLKISKSILDIIQTGCLNEIEKCRESLQAKNKPRICRRCNKPSLPKEAENGHEPKHEPKQGNLSDCLSDLCGKLSHWYSEWFS